MASGSEEPEPVAAKVAVDVVVAAGVVLAGAEAGESPTPLVATTVKL